jgi:superfamily II DNA helicase RecQ
LLDALIRAGCLSVSGGQYPTLSLTELGREVMLKKKVVPLALPEATQPKKRAEKKTAKVVEATDYDAAVFDALKRWRREEATKMGVPAYLVFPDKTLEELARALPESPADLLGIRGIGPAKAQRFGEKALAVIRAAK